MSRGKAGQVARFFVKYILPFIVLFGAVQVTRQLIASRPSPQRQERPNVGVLVELQSIERTSQRLDVQAQGTVVPSRQLVLQPQVTGRVVWQSEELNPGGFFSEDDDILRIERSDYSILVDISRAELERARVAVELEEGRGTIARREWELFQDEVERSDVGRSLALREPQLRDANQMVELAEARLSQARLNLRRTTVSAPFNGYIQSEMVEVGQLVGPTSPLATLIGTDEFWVQVSVPVDRLSLIDVPQGDSGVGSRATVWHEVGGERVEYEGHVVRLLPDLDPVGRMARILVAIDDPMGVDAAEGVRGQPLLLGTFVNVEIEGNSVRDVIEVPRLAIREGDRVFVRTEERTLDIRTVDILWRRPHSVLVSSGLEDGEEIIVSRLGAPIQGMSLRTADEEVPAGPSGPLGPSPSTRGPRGGRSGHP